MALFTKERMKMMMMRWRMTWVLVTMMIVMRILFADGSAGAQRRGESKPS